MNNRASVSGNQLCMRILAVITEHDRMIVLPVSDLRLCECRGGEV